MITNGVKLKIRKWRKNMNEKILVIGLLVVMMLVMIPSVSASSASKEASSGGMGPLFLGKATIHVHADYKTPPYHGTSHTGPAAGVDVRATSFFNYYTGKTDASGNCEFTVSVPLFFKAFFIVTVYDKDSIYIHRAFALFTLKSGDDKGLYFMFDEL
jgi:hypothetical protein